MPSRTVPAALAAAVLLLITSPAMATPRAAQAEGVSVLRIDRAAVARAARRGEQVVIEPIALGADEPAELLLQQFRVTGPQTRFVRGATGEPIAFDPESVVLLRGAVAGAAGSRAVLALSEYGSAGLIDLGDAGGRYAVSSAPGAGITLAADEVAVFEAPPGIGPLLGVPVCGVEAAGPQAPPAPLGAPPSGTIRRVELAVETDFEFFELFGDEAAASAYVVQLYGVVSDIYIRDVGARLELSFVRVWDAEENLYNADDPLGPFVDHWNENMAGVQRDAAQLLTGRRNLPYGGVAYLEALCSEFGYSVSGYALGSFTSLDAPSTGHWDIIVTAHELGHNCGTLHTHDNGIDECAFGVPQRGTIMSYCHTTPGGNANIDLRFHTGLRPFMEAHIEASGCIDADCNGNGVADVNDIAAGDSDDVNGNGVPDECEDCNGNGVVDSEDIAGGAPDDNGNGIPDGCEPDCNGNGTPDDLDIALGAPDLYGDGVPDACDADCNANGISDYNEIQLDLTLDTDRNAVPDACQDCDGDGSTDFEVLAGANNMWVVGQGDNLLAQYHGASGALALTADAGVLSVPYDVVVRGDGHVLVSSFGDNRIVEFDAGGAYAGDLVAAGGGGLSGPAQMAFMPGGDLLVASLNNDRVLRYDAVSGASLGAFVSAGDGGLAAPRGLAFGPDGNLFVTTGDHRVLEYDGGSGAFVGEFVSSGSGGLSGPRGLVFKPDDGNLLVASSVNDRIIEYDGTTGASLGQWETGGLTSGFWALDGPVDLEIGANGDVFATAAGGNARVHTYDVDTGIWMRSLYVLAAAGPLEVASGIAFVPGEGVDCNLNFVPDACDIASGFSADADDNGIPDECEAVPGDLDGDGVVGITDFLALLAAWGPCDEPCPPSCAADLDGDCNVGITDFLALLANWT